MDATLDWIRANRGMNDNFETIFDFSNDRHHATIIKKGASLEEIAFSLHELADRIEHYTCEERNKLKWEIRDGKIVSK